MSETPHGTVLVELDDPWHPKGYRMRVPYTREGDLAEQMTTSVIGDLTELPDPVTRRRPSETETGRYTRTGTASDGVPIYTWQRKA
jgi:hypothetical protein